jgi:hypothetical protein
MCIICITRRKDFQDGVATFCVDLQMQQRRMLSQALIGCRSYLCDRTCASCRKLYGEMGSAAEQITAGSLGFFIAGLAFCHTSEIAGQFHTCHSCHFLKRRQALDQAGDKSGR